MKNIEEQIRNRRSVRTFDGQALSERDRESIYSFIAAIENPYDIPVEFRLMSAKENGLASPVVVGADLYVCGKIKNVPNANLAFGYSFEQLVLFAQSIDVGTVWIGGTMNRRAFEKAMELKEDEIMPCVSPLGYPAEKMSLREGMMRKAINADERLPFSELFFNGNFEVPLTEDDAGRLLYPLEMVRLAPSAVNKQPWRAVVTDGAVHFYLKRSKGFNHSDALDMQMIDMGIALCHFSLAAKERGLGSTFSQKAPEIAQKSDVEYVASYVF